MGRRSSQFIVRKIRSFVHGAELLEFPFADLCVVLTGYGVYRRAETSGPWERHSTIRTVLTLSFRVCLRQEKIYIMGDVGKRIAIAVPFR